MNTIEMRKHEKKWKVESDLDALIRAEEIRADPHRLKDAQALAKERMMAAASVAATLAQPAAKS